MKITLQNIIITIGLLSIPTLNFGQAPNLGTAADFVLFSSVGAITNAGTTDPAKYLTKLTGNVGTNSGSSTGFGNVNGVMHDGDGASNTCAADLLLAYNFLEAAIPDSTIINPVFGNDSTIFAGTYLLSGATSLDLSLTLDAQGDPNAVFIFKMPAGPPVFAFSTNANSKIILKNGAKACNVFWLVSGAVNMGTGTFMRGTIISGGAIDMSASDTLEGRALTINGAINIDNGSIGFLGYAPVGCGSPNLTGPIAPTFYAAKSFTIFSSIGPVADDNFSQITGDVGGNTDAPVNYNPLLVTGGIYGINGITAAAAADLLKVYDTLNTSRPEDIILLAPTLFGHNLVLTPHTYLMNGSVTFTDTVYLDAMGNADAVFIIRTNGAFASSVNSNVALLNGTQAKNVYWLVNGAVSITANSTFNGTIVTAGGAIDILSGTTLNGRALATNGAVSTASINAIIQPIGGNVVPASQIACVGDSVGFVVKTAGVGITYKWRKGNVDLIEGGSILGTTNDTLIINPVSIADSSSYYNVVVFDPFLPNDTLKNIALHVNTAPNITIQPLNVLGCNGDSARYVVTSLGDSLTYQWRKGIVDLINSPTIAGVTTDTLTLYLTSIATEALNYNVVVSGYCPPTSISNNVSFQINGPIGATSFTVGATTVCQDAIDETYTATAANNTSIAYSVLPITAGTINSATGVMNWDVAFNGAATITALSTGCGTSTANRIVTVNPTIGATSFTVGATTVCQDAANEIYTATATNSTSIVYSVLPITAGTINSATGVMNWDAAFNGTATITALSAGCGTSTANRVVTVNPTIGATSFTVGAITVCQDAVDETYTAIATNSTTIAYSVLPITAGTINSATGVMNWDVAFNGTATITALSTGCGTSTADRIVTVKILPIAIATSNSTVCIDSTILLMAQTVTGATYLWTNLTGYSSDLQNPEITSASSSNDGLYSLIITNNGCASIPEDISVLVINCDTIDFMIPEGFSPNSDNVNDVFFIRGIHRYPKNSIVIFNRWGDKVYTKDNYQNTWDGTATVGIHVGQNELPIGTYFYVLDLGDGSKVIKGTIYLNR
jgi:gliding motility-associated-like protein